VVAQPTATSAPAPTTLPTLRGNIVIDGSSTVYPITELATQQFMSVAPNVNIQLGVSGTGGGFKKFCAGITDMSNASRPIKPDESEICRANGIEFVEMPIAFDGVSVIVNRENSWAQCMTLDELKRMWAPESEGVITTWRQIRADWPDQPFKLYAPGEDSGTHDYFTAAIVGKEDASRNDYIGSEDDYVLMQRVIEESNGLAYVGFAYYQEYTDKVSVVAVDAGQGCVLPSIETITDGRYTPLSRPLFIYVRADRLDRPEVRTFVEFYLDNVGQLVQDARYIPLPQRAYELVQQRVEARKTGSIFNKPVPVGVSIEELLVLEGQ
ncbi:MAG: PstS family phosphate ABC transporter substrate-binding protein, partial [Roseiflexus sp.]|nr:PstS family phosphate ABC transporter substrate-binding protein [Roseiflexus sp.]